MGANPYPNAPTCRPTVELGDLVGVDGRAGEVVDIADGAPVVQPFSIPEQRDTPGPPPCFVGRGEVRIIRKHWELEDRGDIERAWDAYGEPDRAQSVGRAIER